MDQLTRFRKAIALLALLLGVTYLGVRLTHLGGAAAWLAWPLFAIEVWGFVHFALAVQQLWPHKPPEVGVHSACTAFDVIVPVTTASTHAELNNVRASLVGARASVGVKNVAVAWGSQRTAPGALGDLAAEFDAAFVRSSDQGAAVAAAWATSSTGVVAIVDPSYVLTSDALAQAASLADHDCIAVVSCDETNDAARFAIGNAGAGGLASIPRGITMIRRTLCDAGGGIQGHKSWREQTTLSFVRNGYFVQVAGEKLGVSLAAESIVQSQARAIDRTRNSISALVRAGSPLRTRGFGLSRRLTMIGRLVAPLDGLRQAALMILGTVIAVVGRLPMKMNALLLAGAFLPWVLLSGLALPALTGFVAKPGDRTRDAMRRIGVVFAALAGARRKSAAAMDVGGVKALKSLSSLVVLVGLLDVALVVRGVAQKASIGLHRLPNAPLGMMLAIMGFQIMMALDVLQMVVRRRQRRTTNRTAVRMAATFDGTDAVAVDVTPSGLGVMTYGVFVAGATVTVGLKLGGAPVEVRGIVRSFNPQNAPTDSLVRVGVELTEVAPAVFDKLVLFCHGGLDSAQVRYAPKLVAGADLAKAPKGQIAKRPGLRAASIFAFLGIATAMAPPYYGASASVTAGGSLGGVVFQDFNANGVLDTTTKSGAVDVGIGGVTVRIVCVRDTGADNIVGTLDDVYADPITTVTKSDAATLGQWAIDTKSLPCRVDIDQTQLALAGFQPGAHGTGVAQSGSTVQFASAATVSLNFGFNKPNDFCQDNPKLVENCFVYGDQIKGTSKELSVLKNFSYGAYGSLYSATNTETAVNMAKASDIGATFGLAYNRLTKTVYASATHKVYAGFGPGGPGAIYAVNSSANTATKSSTTVFATIPDAGVDARASFPANTNFNTGSWISDSTWDTVGKSSLGDIEISEDGSTLWVVNLNNRKLYPVALVTKPGAVGTPVSIPLATGAVGGCTATDVRPYGLGQKDGVLYVGEVCSAQTSNKAADLRVYVYAFNPATGLFSAVPVLESSLVFPRGRPGNGCGVSTQNGDWNPWTATDLFAVKSGRACAYTQPMLSDIVFDKTDMVLGFRDRFGDQASEDHPLGGEGVSGGDILRACGTSATGWKLESNASCGSRVTKGAGNSQGPTATSSTGAVVGGEYYFDDRFVSNHQETSMGGLAQIPGFPDVVSTVFDPNISNGDDWRAGGIQRQNNSTGANTSWYQIFDKCDSSGYNCPAGRAKIGTFGKVNGVGDVVALCDMAPIEFGDRVWLDGNGNGLQDPGEKPIGNVAVSLYAADGTTLLDTATTDANGLYLFSNDTRFASTGAFRYGITKLVVKTDYVIRIANSQGSAQQTALKGLSPTAANRGSNLAGVSDLDKTKAGALILGENATFDSDGLLDDAATDVNARVASGSYGVNNHNIDFGYSTGYSLGNFVFDDVNNNGTADSGEAGIDGVTVNLYADGDANGVPDGPVLQSQLTSAGGYYLFVNLPAFTYIVEVVTPTGKVSSTGTPGSPTGPTEQIPPTGVWVLPTNQTDNLDRGNTAGSVVRSKPIPLNGSIPLPVKEPETPGHKDLASIPDERTNYTIDFGFLTTLTVGNIVWNDANNNGKLDNGEPGIPNVAVRLMSADGTVVGKTTTDAKGAYVFTFLNQGKYYVEIDPPTGFTPSTGGAKSPVMGVTRGANSTNTFVANFGYSKPVSIGNFVWDDANDNGVQDSGELGLAKVSVQLSDAGPDGTAGTADDKVIAQSTTDEMGFYLFSGLPSGVYFVTATTPAGYRSSTGGNDDPNNNVNNDDNGPGAATGDIRSLPLKVVAGSAPINDGDTDPNTNLTLDFGMFKPTAAMSLKTYTNGCDAQKITGLTAPTTACPKDDGAANPVVPVGASVVWTYVVTNTGNVPLAKIAVTDDKLTAASSVSCPSSELAVGATMTCKASGIAVQGQYENTGKVSAVGETTAAKVVTLDVKPEHSDISHYFAGVSKIDIRHYANIADPSGPNGPVVDARADSQAPGGADPTLNYVVPVGSTVYWVYVLRNDGNSAVKSVVLTDDQIGTVTCPATTIEPGKNMTCVAKGTMSKVGQYTNVALATGVDVLSGAPVSTAKDPSNVFVVAPSITITKTTNGIKNLTVDAGSSVTWSYVVRNTGNSSVGGINVTDDKIKQELIDCNGEAAGNGQPIALLAPNTSVTCVAKGVAVKGQYSNTGLAIAVVVDAKGNKIVDGSGNTFGTKASDTASYVGLTSSVGDFVWNDTNANGVQDKGEVGVHEVKVDLYDAASGKVVASTATDKAGSYKFGDVIPGKYFIVFTPPSGWSVSTNVGLRTVVFGLAGGKTDTSWDLGLFQTVSIGDTVFWDKNHNGIYEPKGTRAGTDDDEVGVPNVTVKLFDSRGVEVKIGPDGVLGTKDDAPGGVLTDGNGRYRFSNLTPNTYSVQFLPGASWKFSPRNATNEEQDSDADQTTGQTKSFALSSGQDQAIWDAGIFHDSSIGDRVWADLNGDGLQSDNEPGIAGVRLELWSAGKDEKLSTDDDQLVGVTTSNKKGDYRFDDFNVDGGVISGQSYDIRIPGADDSTMQTPLVGLLPSQPFATDDTKSDSNGEQVSVLTVAHATAPQEGFDSTYDFGFRPAMSIGDKVFYDINNNGRADKGEGGIAGVLVYLYHDEDRNGIPDGGAFDKRLTDEAGNYLFTDLLPGSYIVEIAQSDALKGMVSSTEKDVPSPDDLIDNVNHGFNFKDVVRSKTVTLGAPTTWPVDSYVPESFDKVMEAQSEAVAVKIEDGRELEAVRRVERHVEEQEKFSKYQEQDKAEEAKQAEQGDKPTEVVSTPNPVTTLSNRTVDFGFFRPLSIGDFVWLDANNNGEYDKDEKGVPEVYVTLFTADGQQVAITNTDGSGRYSFDNLAPGRYYVSIDTPNGLVSSTGSLASPTGPFEPAPSLEERNGDNIDRGTTVEKSVRSQVFVLNHNQGELDAMNVVEKKVAEAIQKLDSDSVEREKEAVANWGDEQVKQLIVVEHYNEDEARKIVEQRRETRFKELEVLRQELDSRDGQTVDEQKKDQEQVKEIESLPAGVGSLVSIDFGLTPMVSIGDTIWNDVNDNGVQDKGETGAAKVAVTLSTAGVDGKFDTKDDVIAGSTTTDEKGAYLFGSLPQNIYRVTVEVPTGFRVSAGTQGIIDRKLTEDDLTADFGLFAPRAAISVQKFTNGSDNLNLPVGSAVTWTYLVTNNGNVALTNVEVIDDQKGVKVECPAAVLDVSSSMTCKATGAATSGQYTNNATVSATGETSAGISVPLPDDPSMHSVSHYFGYKPSVTIKKYTNVTDPGKGAGATKDADDAQATGGANSAVNHIVPIGSTAWWLYTVTNTGNTPLTKVAVTDDKLGVVTCPAATLAVNASMNCVASGKLSVAGQYTNVGSVSAQNSFDNSAAITAQDPSSVFVSDPKISIRKLTDNVSTNPSVDAGSTVTWSYIVTNDGNVLLAKVSVSDDKVSSASIDCNGPNEGTGNPIASIQPGATVTCFATGIAVKGQYENVGLVTGTPIDEAGIALTTVDGEAVPEVTAQASSKYVGQVASIGDFVWHDENANGIQDPGEKPIAKVVVTLLNGKGNKYATTTTDEKGHYEFVDLNPGDYSVQFTVPDGWRLTTKGAGKDPSADSNADPSTGRTSVTPLGANENDMTFDAGMYQAATVGDYVWDDRNRDGVMGAPDEEPGISGIAVYLLDSEGNAIGKTKTDDTGHYQFADVVPGKYSVTFSRPVSWTFTKADNSDTGTDSNADVASGQTKPFTLSSGQVENSIDAGMYQQLTVGDRVWVDLNNDGIQSDKEPGLVGVEVQLWSAGGDGVNGSSDDKLVSSVTTNEKGDYQFSDENTKGGILPGVRMNIRIVDASGEKQQGVLAGLLPAKANAGHDDTVDSDGVVTESTMIDKFTTGLPKTNDTTHDFGFTPTYQIGNLVFNDVNNNGKFDEKLGEVGINEVLVSLYADSDHNGVADGDPIAQQRTSEGGRYLFTGLTSSSYVVSIQTGDGPVHTMLSSSGVNGKPEGPFEPAVSPMKNTNDGEDKGTQAKNEVWSGTIDLSPIEGWSPETAADQRANQTIDFGFFTPYESGNLVWNDANNNGIFDKGEQGIAKVEVRLWSVGADQKAHSDDDVLVDITSTNDAGEYQFTDLAAGNYYTVIDAQPGLATSSGSNGSATGPFEPAPDFATNKDDNVDRGTSAEKTIESPVFSAGVDVADRQRIDFGLFASVSITDHVWNDTNDNGKFDSASEKNVAGVAVRIYTAGPDGKFGTDDDALAGSTTTDEKGVYRFDGLRPDDYQVEITMPDHFRSSTGGIRSVTVTIKLDDKPEAAFGIFEPKPSMTLTKLTNGLGANPSLVVAAGADVTWSYIVVNTGNVPLSKVVVTDDHNDVTVKCPVTDVAVGDSMTCTAAGKAIAGNYANVGSVSAFGELTPAAAVEALKPVTATSQYFGTAPGLSVKKYTNVGASLSGKSLTFTSIDDADVPAGEDSTVAHVVPVGTAITWVYVVKNTGNIPLEGLVVSDNDSSLIVECPVTTLAANDNATGGVDETICTSTGTLKKPGQYVNTGTAAGVDNTTTPGTSIAQTASDPSSVFVAEPKISIHKFTQTHDDAGDANAGDGVSLPLASKVTWLYDVTNDGNVTVNDVVVTDDVEAVVTCPAKILAPQASIQCSATGIVKLGKYVNNGSVTATPSAPGIAKVNATDRSAYVGVGASIGDHVWVDLNADGKQDDGEPGLAKVTVNLLDGDGKIAATTATDDKGDYHFADLVPGNYSVQFVTPDGYLVSSTSTTTGPLTIVMGDEVVTADMGMFKLASLGDRVWYDRNGNGTQDEGEKPLANIVVTLLDGHGAKVDSTTTSTEGAYSFGNLRPGTYVVVIDAPDGYKTSPKMVGDDRSVDSDIDGGTHQSAAIVLASGDSNTTVDAGFYTTISIGDTLWIDNNRDGERDPREPPAVGVTVVLYDESDNEMGRQDTGEDGKYLFTDLLPGRYSLRFLNLPVGENPTDEGGGGTTTTTAASTTSTTAESTTTVGPETLGTEVVRTIEVLDSAEVKAPGVGIVPAALPTSGADNAAVLGVEVQHNASKALASTGSNAISLAVCGLALVACGGLLVGATSRRRRDDKPVNPSKAVTS